MKKVLFIALLLSTTSSTYAVEQGEISFEPTIRAGLHSFKQLDPVTEEEIQTGTEIVPQLSLATYYGYNRDIKMGIEASFLRHVYQAKPDEPIVSQIVQYYDFSFLTFKKVPLHRHVKLSFGGGPTVGVGNYKDRYFTYFDEEQGGVFLFGTPPKDSNNETDFGVRAQVDVVYKNIRHYYLPEMGISGVYRKALGTGNTAFSLGIKASF